MRRKRFRKVLFLMSLLLLCGAVAWPAMARVWRQQRQRQLDRDLFASCARLDVARVRALLSAGASPNALQHAVCPPPSLYEVLKHLIQCRAPQDTFGSGLPKHTALAKTLEANVFAAASPQAEEAKMTRIVGLLLDAGADPNAFCYYLKPALDTACEFNHRDCFRLLLRKGAHADYPTRCLAWACVEDDWESAQRLIQRGTDPNVVVRFDCLSTTTPLMAAVERNRVAMTDYLLQHGANPNLRVEDFSPLAWAVHRHESAIASLLKKAGAKE